MSYLVIDVREPTEYADGHVINAVNIPLKQLTIGVNELNSIPKDTHLIVYCRRGIRANKAINTLRHLGFKNISNGINKEIVRAKLKL